MQHGGVGKSLSPLRDAIDHPSNQIIPMHFVWQDLRFTIT